MYCSLDPNFARSKITFLLGTKYLSNYAITLSGSFLSSSASHLNDAKISSAWFPIQYTRVLTCMSFSSLSSLLIIEYRVHRCFHAGHVVGCEKSKGSGGENLAIVSSSRRYQALGNTATIYRYWSLVW